MAASSGASVAAAPLAAGVGFSGGSGPFFVSGASGNFGSQGFYALSYTNTGGTPPYGGPGQSIQGDPSGKLAIVPYGDGVHDTIGWSGFAVNESQTCYIQYDITDSLGATATSRYPASTLITIKRTS